jgi:hypothetical protein
MGAFLERVMIHEGLWDVVEGAEIRLCVLLTDRHVDISPSGTLVWRFPLRPGTPVGMLFLSNNHGLDGSSLSTRSSDAVLEMAARLHY